MTAARTLRHLELAQQLKDSVAELPRAPAGKNNGQYVRDLPGASAPIGAPGLYSQAKLPRPFPALVQNTRVPMKPVDGLLTVTTPVYPVRFETAALDPSSQWGREASHWNVRAERFGKIGR